MATPYLDFLGETPDEEEARMREQQQAAASTPESRMAQTVAANRNAGVNPYDPTRSARTVFGNPIATGQLAAQAQSQQKAAHNALMQRTGGVLGDTAQLAGYLGTLGPARDLVAQYGGPVAPIAALGPIGLAGAAVDAVSPGRKSAPTQGAPAAVGLPGTPSSSSAASSAQPGAPTGTSPFGSPIQRPSSFESSQPIARGDYRTENALQQMQGLLANESRQGPSEAEALLQQATDRAAAQSLGIAAGARGGAGARARARSQAVAANAALGSKASSDIAALRAREDAERRARQAQIMGMISGASQGIDARDLAYAQAEQARRAGLDTLGLGYTNAESAAQQAAASLANTAYQQEADRELRRLQFEAQDRTTLERLQRDPLSLLLPIAGKALNL